jgi:hypothetical protein
LFRAHVLALTAVVLIGPTIARAESFGCREDGTPIERLLVNLESQAGSSQQDWLWYENLARLHATAYAQKARAVLDCWGQRWTVTQQTAQGPGQPDVVPPADAGERANAERHLSRAIDAYAQAIGLAPEAPLPRLGHAWTLQQAGRVTEAIAEYRRTIALAWPGDQRANDRTSFDPAAWTGPLSGRVFITEEAARFLIPLLDPVRDAGEIATLRERTAFIQKGPRAISPIVVPLRRDATLNGLLDRGARVTFDLDGFGPRTWTWVTPDAGWLVFDPKDTGRITSGLQLFGNVTFWLFWQTGYDALRALDDDGDGWLRGKELAGLAIWRDVNRDGVSQAGEVMPLPAWGITELSVSYVAEDEDSDVLASSVAGARFSDGTVRPTFDLILHAH